MAGEPDSVSEDAGDPMSAARQGDCCNCDTSEPTCELAQIGAIVRADFVYFDLRAKLETRVLCGGCRLFMNAPRFKGTVK